MDICVVDTSALIADTDLINKLFWCKVIIHTVVIEELAKLCKKNGLNGARARKVKNELFKIRNRGDFYKGVSLRNCIVQFDDREPDTATYLLSGLILKAMIIYYYVLQKKYRMKPMRGSLCIPAIKFFF